MNEVSDNILESLRLFTSRIVLVAAAVALSVGCAVTPTPLPVEALDKVRLQRTRAVTSGQEVIARPITLHEAMARAIKYNLDLKVEMMSQSLKASELDIANYNMLPGVVTELGFQSRDNYSGSRSSRLLSENNIGSQSLVPSTSSEKQVSSGNLNLSWDILDFGLSYVRANQKADEYLIAQERKRKVVNGIIENVRTAYWRALSAQRLTEQLKTLEQEISSALASSRASYNGGNNPPMAALSYQRELLNINRDVQRVHRDLSVSKQQLAALMNVDPSSHYKLVYPDRDSIVVNIPLKPAEMVKVAMLNRPEVREINYLQRINSREYSAAFLNLLPGLQLFGGFNYDSNEFLYNNHWSGWGARASWNLIEAFKYPAKKRSISAKSALLHQQALALTMAVTTQVHVSAVRFAIARKSLETIKQLYQVQSLIMKQIDAGFRSGRISRQTLIREKMNKILAEAEYDMALSDLQNAYANVYASMGLDPYDSATTGTESVDVLTKKLQQHWLERGDTFSVSDL